MYLNPVDSSVVRRTKTADGEFILYTNGTVKNPNGVGKDINDLLDEPIRVDNTPGNVFQVIGDVMYVVALKKSPHPIIDPEIDEHTYHSLAYLVAIDWKSWTRIWERDIGLGGLTAMAVTDEAVYAAGFREYEEKAGICTLVAKIDLSGELVWMQDIDRGLMSALPHPTEIDVRPSEISIYIDSFNTFTDSAVRFQLDLSHKGQIQNITTL